MSSAFCALCIVHCSTVSVSPHGEPSRHRRRHRRHARARDRCDGPDRRRRPPRARPVRVAARPGGPSRTRATGGAPPARGARARSPRRGLDRRRDRGDRLLGPDARRRCCSTTRRGGAAGAASGAISGPTRSAAASPSDDRRGAADRADVNPALTGFTLPKLLWVREHEPAGVGSACGSCCCRRTTCASG